MRFRSMILLAVLVPASVAAQTTGTTTPIPNAPVVVISASSKSALSRDDCQSNNGIVVGVSFPNGFVTGSTLTVFATDQASCPTSAPDATKVLLSSTTITTTFNRQFTVQGTMLVGKDCPSGQEKTFLVCAVATSPAIVGTTQTNLTGSVTITYDSLAPAAPNVHAITAGDSTLYVSWDSETGVDHFDIYTKTNSSPPPASADVCDDAGLGSSTNAETSSDDAGTDGGSDAGGVSDAGIQVVCNTTGFTKGSTANGTATGGTVHGLANQQNYEVIVVAVDAAGNQSDCSNTQNGTPIRVDDFYRRYRCAGGTDKGGFGCSTAGAVLLPVAGLAALVLIWRRRKA